MSNEQPNKDKKVNNSQKDGSLNEGFSGENLPKNYNPAKAKLTTEIETDTEGNTEAVKRNRDPEEKQAAAVNSTSGYANEDGSTVKKSRGTSTDRQDEKTAENRDFNSDVDGKRQVEAKEPTKK